MKTNTVDFSDPNGVSEGVLTHATTAPQAWILPDNTGTIALTSDIPIASSIITYDSVPPSNPQLGDIWEDTSRSNPHSDRWIYMTCEGITDWWSELKNGGGHREESLGSTYTVGEVSPTYSANTICVVRTYGRVRANTSNHTSSSYFSVNAGYFSGAGVYVNLTTIPMGNTIGLTAINHRWFSTSTSYIIPSTALFFGITVVSVGGASLYAMGSTVFYRIRLT